MESASFTNTFLMYILHFEITVEIIELKISKKKRFMAVQCKLELKYEVTFFQP